MMKDLVVESYEAYLFDLDGTLIDTTELIYQCFCYSLKEHANSHGVPIERGVIYRGIGRPLKVQMQNFFSHHGVDTTHIDFDSLTKKHMDFQTTIWQEHLKIFDDSKNIVANLKKNNKKLAIVTSRYRDSAKNFLNHVGLFQYFDALITPEDTSNPKPHPEPVLKALKLLGCNSNEALMVGDSGHDMNAAYYCNTDFFLVSRGDDGLANQVTEEERKKKCKYFSSDLSALQLKGD